MRNADGKNNATIHLNDEAIGGTSLQFHRRGCRTNRPRENFRGVRGYSASAPVPVQFSPLRKTR